MKPSNIFFLLCAIVFYVGCNCDFKQRNKTFVGAPHLTQHEIIAEEYDSVIMRAYDTLTIQFECDPKLKSASKELACFSLCSTKGFVNSVRRIPVALADACDGIVRTPDTILGVLTGRTATIRGAPASTNGLDKDRFLRACGRCRSKRSRT